MEKEIEKERGPHRRLWGGRDGVEEDRVDEILELIWKLREKGVSDLDRLLETTQRCRGQFHPPPDDQGWSFRGGRQSNGPQGTGEEKAREIIRRHRLTERLLSEIFEMPGEEVESRGLQTGAYPEPDGDGERLHFPRPPAHLHPWETDSQRGMLHQVQERDEAPGHSS